MNEKSLEKNLANLERELVNLQTAHDVGLGSVSYYQYADIGNTGQNIVGYILINVKSGDRLNPIIEFFADTTKVAQPSIIKSNVYSDRYVAVVYSLALGAGAIYPWKIVSTSRIEYKYAYTAQEAEDWLGGY